MKGRSGLRKYAREEPTIDSRTFLIVTEGEKTEPKYFQALAASRRMNGVRVRHPEGTDPMTLVDYAIEIQNDSENSYDEIWVVFDYEGPQNQRRRIANNAVQRAQASGIFVATSNPCFEYWLALHSEYSTKPHASCDKLTKAYNKSKRQDMKLRKSMSMSELVNHVDIAVAHAAKCHKHHEDTCVKQDPSTWNPYSSIHILVQKLMQSAVPFYLRKS